MNIATISRIGFVLFFCLLVWRYSKKLLQNNTAAGRSAITKFVLAGVLIGAQTIAKAFNLLDDAPMLVHLVTNTAQHYGLMFGYMATDQALSNKEYRPIIRSKSFLITTILSIIVIGLEVLGGDISSFSDNEVQNITPLYYGANLIHYLILLGTGFAIIGLYSNSIRKYQRIDFTVIRIITISSLLVINVGLISVIMNLTISFFVGHVYSTTLNTIYHLSKLGFGVILIVQGFAGALLTRIVQFVNQRLAIKQQETSIALKYLHERITNIVPVVVLEDDEKDIDSMIIEISDADEIIFSHQQYQQPETPQQQAKHLYHLLQSGKIIQDPGDQLPPTRKNLLKHYITVAKHLKELESQHEGDTHRAGNI